MLRNFSNSMMEKPWFQSISTVAVISCVFYSFCSVSMVLSNKELALYSDGSTLPEFSILLVQNAIAALVILLLKFMGVLSFGRLKNFDWHIVLKWFPVNILFIGMILTGLQSLHYVNVPMVTVFKNLTNILIAAGDAIFHGSTDNFTNPLILISFVLTSFGAFLAAYGDLEFNWSGYLIMMMNCIFAAGYVIQLKSSTKQLNQMLSVDGTASSSRVSTVVGAYYNNLISLPILLLLVLFWKRGENQSDGQIYIKFISSSSSFLMLNLFSGFVGFALSLSSLWCVDRTSATTYAVVGALNKIPISVFGYFLFGANITGQAFAFLCLSLFGGLLYSLGKMQQFWVCFRSSKLAHVSAVDHAVDREKQNDNDDDEENGHKTT